MHATMQAERGRDHFGYKTVWLCEKWSEDAVVFARKKLERLGISHIPAELRDHNGIMVPRLMPIKEGITSAMLRLLVGDPEEAIEIAGNLLLNEGIAQIEDLFIAALSNQVAANPYSNGNSFIGVGDSSTAEAASQTDLQAAANHFYKAMNATFPSRSSQTVTFQSDFTSAEANYVWAEWTIAAGATTASGAGFTVGTKNLNRKVQALGTKATGTWTLSGQVALS